MLLYAYNHIGGENIPLVQGTVPISPTTGYSHANLNQIIDGDGNSVFNAKSVRFYCHTSGHTRKIHFYTSNSIVDQIAYDGRSINNNVGIWTSEYTVLPGHTGYLPAATNSFASGETIGLFREPFFTWYTYHWNINSYNNRFECDDFPADNSQSTLHQIWVNTCK
jgi:hypothetical protein